MIAKIRSCVKYSVLNMSRLEHGRRRTCSRAIESWKQWTANIITCCRAAAAAAAAVSGKFLFTAYLITQFSWCQTSFCFSMASVYRWWQLFKLQCDSLLGHEPVTLLRQFHHSAIVRFRWPIKSPLEQSAARHHISSNTCCVLETSVLSVISFTNVSSCNSSAHRVQWFSNHVAYFRQL